MFVLNLLGGFLVFGDDPWQTLMASGAGRCARLLSRAPIRRAAAGVKEVLPPAGGTSVGGETRWSIELTWWEVQCTSGFEIPNPRPRLALMTLTLEAFTPHTKNERF